MSYWQNFKCKTVAGVCCGAMCLQLSSGIVLPTKAEAFDIGNAMGALIGTAVQYEFLNKQLNYLDNDGRQEYFEQMKQQIGVADNEQRHEMLGNIIVKLSAAIAQSDPSINDKPYNYFVNKETTYNAFCSAGHNISVNTGMFDLVNDREDELAIVIAHEMGHGQKDHVLKGVKKSMPLDLLTNLYQSQNPNAVSIIGAKILNNSIHATQMTKPQEVEADNLAFDYTVKAGYNIGAGAATWQRFIDKMGESKGNFIGDLFSPSDHPSHQSRRDSYSDKLTDYSNGNIKVDSKTGLIKIKDKDFIIPAAMDTMSSQERSYLIAGNLAAVYHNSSTQGEASYDGETIYIGSQAIMTPLAGEDGQAIVVKLNGLR